MRAFAMSAVCGISQQKQYTLSHFGSTHSFGFWELWFCFLPGIGDKVTLFWVSYILKTRAR